MNETSFARDGHGSYFRMLCQSSLGTQNKNAPNTVLVLGRSPQVNYGNDFPVSSFCSSSALHRDRLPQIEYLDPRELHISALDGYHPPTQCFLCVGQKYRQPSVSHPAGDKSVQAFCLELDHNICRPGGVIIPHCQRDKHWLMELSLHGGVQKGN